MSQSVQDGDALELNVADPVVVRGIPTAPDTKAPREAVEPNVEMELKLLCDPKHLAEVVEAPIVARYARDGGQNVDLTAIYYDTLDLDLRKSGRALRVHTDGKRFVMTLESKKQKAGKAVERTEWKLSVPNMAPDHAALSQFLRAESLTQIKHKPLKPMFRTEIRHRAGVLDTPLGMVQFAADRGRIVAGDRSEDISEIELGLINGNIEAVFSLAQELISHFPLRPSIRSKRARGFDLALGTRPKTSKAPEVKFENDTTLDQMFDALLRATVQHLLQNQPAAEDGHDPDGIHQYRMALRRLRSALRLMRPVVPSVRLDLFQEDARWLMSNLNEARDWDVFVTETLPYLSQVCPTIEGFDVLASASEDHWREAHAKAKKAISDRRTGQFQIALKSWIEQAGWRTDATPKSLSLLAEPARGYVSRALGKLHRKALNRGERFNKLSLEERHKVRLALKRLRDATGFFPPLLGKKKIRHRYGSRLARLQAQLGHDNDMSTAEEIVRQMSKEKMPAAGHYAAGAFRGWRLATQYHDDTKRRTAWRKFRQAEFNPR